MEAHRTGLLLSLEQSTAVDRTRCAGTGSEEQTRYAGLGKDGLRYPGLAQPKQLGGMMLNRTQPHHPQRSRRIQSAPSVALSNLPASLLDDLDAWETDDFTLNEWVVPEVRAKALRQQEVVAEVEDWEDDFDGDEEVEIPVYMQSIQKKFETDMLRMRQFALHIDGTHILIQTLELFIRMRLSCKTAFAIRILKMWR